MHKEGGKGMSADPMFTKYFGITSSQLKLLKRHFLEVGRCSCRMAAQKMMGKELYGKTSESYIGPVCGPALVVKMPASSSQLAS